MLLKFFSVIGALSLVAPFVNASISAHEADLAKALQERDSSAPTRELKAATKATYLAKRHANFVTTNEIELAYTERENLDSELNFGATVRAKSRVPILLLEDFEHLSEDIVCQPGYIAIRILPGVDRISTGNTLLNLADGGLVITSHYGCNDHGERRLFKVGNVNIAQDGSSFMLETVDASWETSFSKFDIQMCHTRESHALRPHEELRRRQDSESPTTTADNQPTLAIPDPTGTAEVDPNQGNANTLDVNEGLIDKRIIGSDNSSLQITCKNCSTFGTIDFSFIQFSFVPDIDLSDGFGLNDFLQGGEVTVIANNLGARVELLTNITRSNTIEIPLFEIPLLLGIAIKGIGSAGLIYAPKIKVDYQLNNGSITFTYGFEVTVPDKSRIFLDMTNPGNSSVTGFGETKVDSIPFQADVDVNEATIDVALRHQIQVGFKFNPATIDVIEANIGLYLDLPKFVADFTHLTNVDENCNALSSSQSENREVAQNVLTDVYQVNPTVDWQVGVAGAAHILKIFPGGEFDHPFDNGTISTVPSSCLFFNKTSGEYLDATEVVEKAKKNAAGQLRVTYAACGVAVLGVIASLLF